MLERGGRLLLVDLRMGEPGAGRSTPHSHGHFDLDRLVPLVEQSGFEVTERGPVPFALRRFERLGYALAAA